jgi:ankyrin repeat protein
MAEAQRRTDELGKALIGASQDGNVLDICRLINQGADVEYVFKFIHEGLERSITPLILAAGLGHADTVEVLISKNADVNKPEPCLGLTALHIAAQTGHVPVMQLLISKGVRIDVRSKRACQTPLHQTACYGHKDAAIYLLDHGADINAAGIDGATPLMVAAQEKHLPLVDLFLVRGADPNIANSEGWTALHKASFDGILEITELLVEGGANVDKMDKQGASPLHLAAQEGHLEVVKLLARNGANIHLAKNQGLTPLHIATFNGRNEVVDYLVNKGAKLEDQGNAVARACKYCGVMDVPTMQKCSGCKVVWYCGPVCQKKDWLEGGENKHKVQCPRIKEQRELYKEKKKHEWLAPSQQPLLDLPWFIVIPFEDAIISVLLYEESQAPCGGCVQLPWPFSHARCPSYS